MNSQKFFFCRSFEAGSPVSKAVDLFRTEEELYPVITSMDDLQRARTRNVYWDSTIFRTWIVEKFLFLWNCNSRTAESCSEVRLGFWHMASQEERAEDKFLDFILVWAKERDPALEQTLRDAGLELIDLKRNMTGFAISFPILARVSEELAVLKELKGGTPRRVSEFQRRFSAIFKDYREDPDYFSSGERQLCINHVLMNHDYCGDQVKTAMTSGIVQSVFPLHEPQEKKSISFPWTGHTNTELIENIKKYFGTDLAFYFYFASFYTEWLVVPAILGIVFHFFDLPKSLEVANLVYPLFYSTYIAIFFKVWMRRNSELTWKWGVPRPDVLQPSRHEFNGESRHEDIMDTMRHEERNT